MLLLVSVVRGRSAGEDGADGCTTLLLCAGLHAVQASSAVMRSHIDSQLGCTMSGTCESRWHKLWHRGGITHVSAPVEQQRLTGSHGTTK
jgi:hypothetical protein